MFGKADIIYKSDFGKILPILIHGDAAVAGLGIVYEVAANEPIKGLLKTGGTVHFVINNQVGFTTDFGDARSSNYCSSIANVTQSPILRVKMADNPEACAYAMELAVEFRQYLP